MKPLAIVHTENSCGWGGQEIRILTEARGFSPRPRGDADRAGRSADRPGRRGASGFRSCGCRSAQAAAGAASRCAAGSPAHRASSTSSTPTARPTAGSRPSPRAACATHRRSCARATSPRRCRATCATRWLYREAPRRIVVTTGERLRLQVIEETACRPERVVSIPTGIDLDRFRPGDAATRRAPPSASPASAALIGIVATLRSWKGHRYLFEAFAGLADRGARLVVVGDGPQREALEALAHGWASPRASASPGNQATSRRGCAPSTSSACPPTRTKACRRRSCRRWPAASRGLHAGGQHRGDRAGRRHGPARAARGRAGARRGARAAARGPGLARAARRTRRGRRSSASA